MLPLRHFVALLDIVDAANLSIFVSHLSHLLEWRETSNTHEIIIVTWEKRSKDCFSGTYTSLVNSRLRNRQ
jgi:hypothetical protein